MPGTPTEYEKDLARHLLEVIPRTMRHVRGEMRVQAESALSIPQFRVLVQLSIKPSCNRELAEGIGVSVPAMSRMVEQLVKRGLVARDPNREDRRQVWLRLTPTGQKKFERIRESAQANIAERIARLSAQDRKALATGLAVLTQIFI